MRKIFLFFIATLFSVSMWADCFIAGSWTSWDDNKVPMVASGSYQVAKIYFGAADYHQFKVVDSQWYGLSGDGTMTTTSYDWVTYGNSDKNVGINAFTVGNYVFVYEPSTHKVSVIWPDVSIIAAGSEAVFGSNWDGSDTNNKLTTTDSLTYTLTKTDVEVASGNYEFKIVVDNNWTDKAFPASNKQFSLDKSGLYDITITFNVVSREVTIESTLTKEEVILPTINLGGEWYTDGEGNWLKGAAFIPAAGDETASTTIHFDEGQTGYSFKVIVNDDWRGHAKISETKPFTFDRGTTGARGWSGDDAAYIWIDKAGDYEFTWTYATDSLSVVYPTLANSAVTISAPEHVTISVKNGEEAIGATVQELTQLTITASADEGYRVMSTSAYLTAKTDSAITITDNKLLMPGAALTITAEVGLVNGYYLVGDFNDVPAWGIADLTPAKKLVENPDNAAEYMIENVTLIAEDSLKIANVVDNAITWYAPNAANYVVDSNHAGSSKTVYFRPAGDGDEKWWYNCIYVPDNSGGTAIDNTADEAKAVKRIVNGQLVIEREGKLFNALGAEVK